MKTSLLVILCAIVVGLIGFSEGRYRRIDHEEQAKYLKEQLPPLPRIKRTGHMGVTGPVHTFQKTNKEAHFKWGVKHLVGHQFAG